MLFENFNIFNLPHFKEKYNSNPHFADNLTEKYKEFELKYNEILKERYPSFSDELKRQSWFSEKIALNTKDLMKVVEGVRYLISSNFINARLITDDNQHLVKYLTEKKTNKIYKIKSFNSQHYWYSTLGKNTILSVRFDIKLNKTKKKVIIKYSQGYLAEQAFTFMSYGETRQSYDAKKEFKKQFFAVEHRIKKHLGLLEIEVKK